MLEEVPGYADLQEQTAAATDGSAPGRILELGVGTGETSARVLARHPDARLTGIDASVEMLDRARKRLPESELLVRRLEDPLPAGPFDLVVSALAVHHLDGDGKRDLFRRIHAALRPGGRFVLADVVVPEREEDVVTPIDGVIDLPDSVADQLAWLAEIGFAAETVWQHRDLAVLRAERRRA